MLDAGQFEFASRGDRIREDGLYHPTTGLSERVTVLGLSHEVADQLVEMVVELTILWNADGIALFG